MEFDKRSIKVEFFKSSGPGGQHKNKKKTAVKLTYIPTRVTIRETRERSQTQNLKNALNKLDIKLKKLHKKGKKRVATKPTKISRENRLKYKKFISKKKKMRLKNIKLDNL
ncbi:MAG: peptide chain release factor-like protein [Candidatus Omnitrophota bacterium]